MGRAIACALNFDGHPTNKRATFCALPILILLLTSLNILASFCKINAPAILPLGSSSRNRIPACSNADWIRIRVETQPLGLFYQNAILLIIGIYSYTTPS